MSQGREHNAVIAAPAILPSLDRDMNVGCVAEQPGFLSRDERPPIHAEHVRHGFLPVFFFQQIDQEIGGHPRRRFEISPEKPPAGR